MSRNLHATVETAEYEFEVSITVRRRTSEYGSTKLAAVTLNESVTCDSPQSTLMEFERVTTEATNKARRAMGIRVDAERKLLELEAGPVTV